MPRLPLTITLARPEQDISVDLEVTFLAEDDARPAEHLFGTDNAASTDSDSALRVIRAAAAALGARVLGGAGAVHVLGGVPLHAVVGLGKRAEITLDGLRRGAAQAIACATDLHRASLAISLPADVCASIASDVAVQVVAEGALLAAHARTPRATLTPKLDAARPPTRCVLRVPSAVRAPPSAAQHASLRRAEAHAAATLLAR
ncbi:MAG TPA: M17 family peptidase N-terminal domain-containing protein, partial [Burkholderiaceae bacterium]|nr:M17 family peptidase N-terminal domain-containing protein [Burkholderiaceae bacterium]